MPLQNELLFPKPSDSRFRIFHELMSKKIREILLVSSPYDAFILEEDGILASRIINEYKGLNLSQPPRITRASSSQEALSLMENQSFDMVITMPHLDDMDAFSLGLKIKGLNPDLPVMLLVHSLAGIYPFPKHRDCSGIDKIYIWSGFSDLLLALVKNAEDNLNVDLDTKRAGVRVLILVEDSPFDYSSLLPLMYKEIVKQTQAVIESGLNEQHRLLVMRTRPKILLAENYEQAIEFFQRHKRYVFGVISDTRFRRKDRIDDNAGVRLLSQIRKEIPYLPLLLLSSETKNRKKADKIPALFLDKNSPDLIPDLHDFFLNQLGFGDFIFRMPEGSEIGRASTLNELEQKLSHIHEESIRYHSTRNDFSNWIMGRAEIPFASMLKEIKVNDLENIEEVRNFLIRNIKELRKWRQKGVVIKFNKRHFDPDCMDFIKIGNGSLGGKARGLAFMSNVLEHDASLHIKFPDLNISIPKTLVISTDGFESFMEENRLSRVLQEEEFRDDEINHLFLNASMPEWFLKELEIYIRHVGYPLAVRSSSLLEDARVFPYAGLYKTLMIPNNDPRLSIRLEHLTTAIKLIYASAFHEGPRLFSKRITNIPHDESMAIIVQKLAGKEYGDYFFPAISGTAQSHNYYPIIGTKPGDGVAQIVLGMGKTIAEGGKSLRFCPKIPDRLPHFSTINDILENCQRSFYALGMKDFSNDPFFFGQSNLASLDINNFSDEFPITYLSGTYIQDEHRIRDSGNAPGPRILNFANILKYRAIPLPEILCDLLELGRKNLGSSVIIEFSIDLNQTNSEKKGDFHFLQIRPMSTSQEQSMEPLDEKMKKHALCFSQHALGNGINNQIVDILYVKPEAFKPGSTTFIASEIGGINKKLAKDKNNYLLIGPGRWGSADKWLGIPVQWKDISGVGAIIEMKDKRLNAEASQGSHFFHNITSLGIFYMTVDPENGDFLDWNRMESFPIQEETRFLRHVRLNRPLNIKVNGMDSKGMITIDA